MKVTIISGSPRSGQNSEKITQRAEAFFKQNSMETAVVKLSETLITPCVHCDACKKQHICTKDDKANEVNELLESSDGILLISPVYFGSMTAQLKAFIDKTLPLRRNNMALKGKFVAAIAVGGSRNGGQELTLQQIHGAFLVHGMIICGDNSHFGGIAHNPYENDETGSATVEGTLQALQDVILRVNYK